MINKLNQINIIKVTEDCNFNCLYCLREKKKSPIIDLGTIDNYYRELSRYKIQRLNNIWHGGEPLLAGVNFFEEAVKIVRKRFPNSKIVNSIQTNGSLIDEEYVDFFKRYNFRIGVSFDGPPHIHNIGRVDEKGQPTYEKVVMGIEKLQRANIQYGLICLLNKNSFGHEEEIYHTLAQNSAYARLNVYVPMGLNRNNRQKFEIQIEDLSRSLIKFFQLWKKEESDFRFSPFYEVVYAFFDGKNKICEFSRNCCTEMLALDSAGNIYPCGRFSKATNFIMGNINTQSLDAVLSSEVEKKRNDRLGSIDDECQTCEYKPVCEGGCAHQSYAYGNYLSKTPNCEALKSLFSHIKGELQ